MAKIWRVFPGIWCPFCDSAVLIHTEQSLDEGYGYEGDSIQCIKCEAKGKFRPFDESLEVDWDQPQEKQFQGVDHETLVILIVVIFIILWFMVWY